MPGLLSVFRGLFTIRARICKIGGDIAASSFGDAFRLELTNMLVIKFASIASCNIGELIGPKKVRKSALVIVRTSLLCCVAIFISATTQWSGCLCLTASVRSCFRRFLVCVASVWPPLLSRGLSLGLPASFPSFHNRCSFEFDRDRSRRVCLDMPFEPTLSQSAACWMMVTMNDARTHPSNASLSTSREGLVTTAWRACERVQHVL